MFRFVRFRFQALYLGLEGMPGWCASVCVYAGAGPSVQQRVIFLG